MESPSGRRRYPTDLTDAQWQWLEPLLPPNCGVGRPTRVDLREIVNALLYLKQAGCAWRLLPHDFPNWTTVRYYFDKWILDGTWEASIRPCASGSASAPSGRPSRPPGSWTAKRSRPPKRAW